MNEMSIASKIDYEPAWTKIPSGMKSCDVDDAHIEQNYNLELQGHKLANRYRELLGIASS